LRKINKSQSKLK